jgi:3-hydroxybutyryl-CoA dehydratase
MDGGIFFEDLKVGMTASITRVVSDEDVRMFAQSTGDTNPVHLDDAAAAKTPFKQRVAHGMLSAAMISAVLGTRLPGEGSIYLSQSLRFRAPVMIGEEVLATVEVTALDTARKRATLSTICSVDGKPVLTGEALVMVDSRVNANL